MPTVTPAETTPAGHPCRGGAVAGALTAVLACVGVAAQEQPVLEEIEVIAVTPSQGMGVDRGKVSLNVQSATAEDLDRSQALDLTDFLNHSIGSVHINQAQNNPLQPDVQFRGFTASPLLGLQQGLAVYQNGARVNEPLGDAVNWDLIPEGAIHSIDLIAGANPLFGLNTLGGALSVRMKNGFNTDGHSLEAYGGSFERYVVDAESGGNNGTLGYYVNVRYFDEAGWRDLSDSDALNTFAAFSFRGERTDADLSFSYADTSLIGNGASPVGLLALDREAVFTAPDITENELFMGVFEANHFFNDYLQLSVNAFYRRTETESFNGDASEFVACELGNGERLLDGIEDDDVELLGFELEDELCNPAQAALINPGGFADAAALEAFLDGQPGPLDFIVNDFTPTLSGTGAVTDTAINNISSREQDSYGSDWQLIFAGDVFGRENYLVIGGGWFRGESDFEAVVELSELDPVTFSTEGLGVGTFVGAEATSVSTITETWSVYFTDTFSLTRSLHLTVSGRYNDTHIEIEDQSDERPELNGEHDFSRFNPAAGVSWEALEVATLYGNWSESSRAPTPIELTCNDEIAAAFEARTGNRGFDCRLPNAFVADPPLEQVVTTSYEGGLRGEVGSIDYNFAYFHSTNEDDIIFQSTGRTTGLFANVDETRRRGVELNLRGTWAELDWFASYTWLDATFESEFISLSGANPNATDLNGDGRPQEILVNEGDRIPGIPRHQLKLGGTYYFTPKLSMGVDILYNYEQFLRGDETNDFDTIDEYVVVNWNVRWELGSRFELFAKVNNVFDTKYETFGLLGEDPTEVHPEVTDETPIFVGAGAPVGAWVGIRVRL